MINNWEEDSVTYVAGELLKRGNIDGEDLWYEFKKALTEFTNEFFVKSFIESRNN